MPLIRIRKPALEPEIVDELHGSPPGSAETRHVVDRFREGIEGRRREAAAQPLCETRLAGVKYGITVGGLISKHRRIGNRQSRGKARTAQRTVRYQHYSQPRAFSSDV